MGWCHVGMRAKVQVMVQALGMCVSAMLLVVVLVWVVAVLLGGLSDVLAAERQHPRNPR